MLPKHRGGARAPLITEIDLCRTHVLLKPLDGLTSEHFESRLTWVTGKMLSDLIRPIVCAAVDRTSNDEFTVFGPFAQISDKVLVARDLLIKASYAKI